MLAEPIRRSVCPLCGQPTIVVSRLYQYSLERRVGVRGKLLKKVEKSSGHDMEVENARCDNPNCDASWTLFEFDIEDGKFLDYKYADLEESAYE